MADSRWLLPEPDPGAVDALASNLRIGKPGTDLTKLQLLLLKFN